MDYSVQSIKELFQQASPVTGAVSLDFSTPPVLSNKEQNQNGTNSNSRPSVSPQNIPKKQKWCSSSSNPINEGQWKTLRPLKHPSMIVGTIHLWNSTSHFRACSLNSDCLAFTDDTATICCVVLDLDPCVIGHRVQVLSWNFIPGKSGIGYLEINKWRPVNELPRGNNSHKFNFPSLCLSPAAARSRNHLLESPLCKESVRRSRTVLSGRLYSMSPPFVLPCSNSSNVSRSRKNKSVKDDANHIACGTPEDRTALLKECDSNKAALDIPDCKKDLFRMHLDYGKAENCPKTSTAFSMRDDNKEAIFGAVSREDYKGGKIPDNSNEKLRVPSMDGNNKEEAANKKKRPRLDDNTGLNSNRSPKNSTVLAEINDSKTENSCNANKKSGILSRSNDSGEENVLGFLVELRVCNHKFNCGIGSEELLYHHVAGEKHHSCVKPAFVYFTGSAAAWRPVLSCLFGKCLSITGLKKKTMLVGEEKEVYNVFVATGTTVLTLVSPVHSSTGSNDHTGFAFTARLDPDVCKQVSDLSNGEASSRRKTHVAGHGKDGIVGSFSGMTTSSLTMTNQVKERSRTGSYIGIVTGIHMQGALVELDRSVWLLLTHYLLTQVHGLRVGVLLVSRHVHFIKIQIASEKTLLLGACFKSHIVVKLFSPLRTPFIVRPHAQSLLSRYIKSLPFTAAFWVLLVISCFRQKFQGIFCEKDILGSKNCEGMVQRYVHSRYHSSHSQHQDVLKEFFNHEHNCYMGKETKTQLQLIAPMINFCKRIEAKWLDHLSLVWNTQGDTLNGASIERGYGMRKLGVNTTTNQDRFVRQIISSKEFGVALVGILQVSRQSGQLQLADATGVVDAIVPDFLSNSALQNIYEVTDFKIVIEGFGGQLGLLKTDCDVQQISCASIFHGVVFKSKPFSATYYIHFYLKKAIKFDVPRWPEACADKLGHFKTRQNGIIFRIIVVTHKHPINCKPCVDKTHQCASSSFAEAVLLPHNIVNKGSKWIDHNRNPLEVEITDTLEDGSVSDCNRECSYEGLKKLKQFACSKTRQTSGINAGVYENTNVKSTPCETSTLINCNGHGIQDSHSDTFFKEQNDSKNYSCKQFQLETPKEVPCYLLFRRLFKGDVLLSGILSMSRSLEEPKMLLKKRPDSKKIILEFDSESMGYYQLLQIGDCYLIQYEAESRSSDLSLNSKKADKVLVTSENPVWSLAFSDHLSRHPNGHEPSSCGTSLYDSSSLTLALYNVNEPPDADSVESERFTHEWGQAPSVHFRDVVLYLPHSVMNLLQMFIKQVKDETIPVLMGVCDVVDKFLVCRSLRDGVPSITEAMVSYHATNPRDSLPEGELISFRGEVKDVCFKGLSTFPKQNRFGHRHLCTDSHFMFLKKVAYTILIQDSDRAQKIRLHGTFNACMLPVGLGPGVTASFYRILFQSGSNGVQELLATSASFIVINAVKEVHYNSNGRFNTEVGNQMQTSNYQDIKDSALISCLAQCFNKECFMLRCRVMAVQSLVLEWQPGKWECTSQSVGSSRAALHSIGIISANFILGDGSGLCDCWASSERAAYLLSIYSTALENFEVLPSACKILKRGTKKKLVNTVDYLLAKLVKKHRQVIVQNNRMDMSPLHAELVIQGASKEILNPEEKKLISFVLAKACNSAPLMIVASILSSVGPQTGGINCDQVEMTTDEENFSTLTHCRIRILARNVAPVNYLQETANIVQELASKF